MKNIIEFIKRVEITLQKNLKFHRKPIKNFNHLSNDNNEKYCSYHKQTKHDSSECRNKRLESYGKNNKLNNMIVQENYNKNSLICFPSKIHDQDTIINIDTGSQHNCVSEKFAEKFKFPQINVTE
ncbi:hypothetical protein DMUE_1850 [Dictyocoela muelleri]|nr:hypothetical protein DMUE_1850 [Dictyocoela muelleri]